MSNVIIQDDLVSGGKLTEADKRKLKRVFVNLSKGLVVPLGGEQGNETNNE